MGCIARRKAMMYNDGGTPPSRYLECEYIQTDGTQYIDTEMMFNSSNDIFEVEFLRLDAASAGLVEFGLRDFVGSATSNVPCVFLNYSGGKYRIDVQDKQISAGIGTPNYNVNQWAIFSVDFPNKKAYWSGTTYDASRYIDGGYDYKCSLVLCTFNRNGTPYVRQYAKSRWKYLKQWRSGVLIKNLIAAYDTVTEKYGLYDTINDNFIVNAIGNDLTGLVKNT